jgi:hypothetical protein
LLKEIFSINAKEKHVLLPVSTSSFNYKWQNDKIIVGRDMKMSNG